MDKSRLEWRVGLFVGIGLLLLAGLLIQFSKGTTFFRPGYSILLQAPTVGGLKMRAQVLMSGIQVGSVANMQLGPEGTNVIITLRIFQPYRIFKDARFVIEQSGFLGDQYVAILPTKNEGGVFKPGDEATVQAPLDLQEVARKVADLLGDIGSAAKKVNTALTNAGNTVLSSQSLTNLAAAISNFHRVSERSLAVAENVEGLVESNRAAITRSVSNFLKFSDQANQGASDWRQLMATNSRGITMAVSNLESSSAALNDLLEGVRQGRGLAGKLLVDERIAADMSQIADNVSITTSNLAVTTSNLNSRGLWGILWKPKQPRPSAPAPARQPLTSPKNPFN